MIYLFYGEDRLSAEKAAKKVLGSGYENIDAENLQVSDLPTLFLGTSLFEENRKILIKGLADRKELFDETLKYLETPHEIVILENKINGNLASFKALKKNPTIKIQEFKLPEVKDKFLSFNIYSTALNNPEKALEMLRKNEETEDPYMMLGAWTSKAVDALKSNPKSAKNRKILKELAKVDMLLKTTNYSNEPWIVMESFILKLKTL